jgi:hypothetical protein
VAVAEQVSVEADGAAAPRLIQQSTDASEAAALVLAIQEFVANGGGRPWSAPPECCIAGADGQSWPCRSAWLVAFRSSRLDDRFEGVPRVPDRTKCDSEVLDSDVIAMAANGHAPGARLRAAGSVVWTASVDSILEKVGTL